MNFNVVLNFLKRWKRIKQVEKLETNNNNLNETKTRIRAKYQHLCPENIFLNFIRTNLNLDGAKKLNKTSSYRKKSKGS